MSLARTAGALAPSILRSFAAPSSAARRCPQCLRTFSSSNAYRQSSKRQLQTASAYHPSSLHSEPPPRNFGVPDTSIAGGRPEVQTSIPPRLTPEQHNTATPQEQARVSIPEGEAQTSQPTSTTKPLRPRRYKFGARKATIKLTPSAVSHLQDLLDQPEPKLIRIGTRAKGCSGLAYHLEYVDKPSALDEQVEQDGVKVLIDNKALLNIIGSEMDWLEDKLNERFVFKNPNITEQCGCGESFSVG
ncbi:iron sulfur assembly protein 1 [Lophiotrema nucula]|uniref:Iron-sulfur assembly protein 1 n=1 Tax=Lophiotrema nucula TaxID=690887 RepID=A0A6A5Z5F1_9PLEO|nr:iron sulfur assembly protein 1 [Lophiotrema nucula]